MNEEILYKLPEGWKKEKLGSDDFKIRGSGIERFEGEKDYLSTESIQGTKIEKIESKISYKKRPSRANMQPVLNSIWFAKMKGTTKVYCFDETNKSELNKYILSTGFTGINPLNCEAKFLKYFFLSPNFNLQKDNFSTGTTQVAINNDGIKKIEIIYPESKEEQILIVQEIEKQFTHLDAAVKSLKTVKNKLEVYRKSVLKAAFDNIKKYVKANDICKIVSGSTPRTNNPEFWGGSIPWITPKDLSGYKNKYISNVFRYITKKGYNSCSTQLLPKRSVLMSSRAPIGYLVINEVEMCTNQGFKTFVFDEKTLYSEFLYYYLLYKVESLKKSGSGTTFNELSGSKAKQILIPLCEIGEQTQIVQEIESRFSVIDKLEGTVDNALLKAEQLRKSILKSAFEGKLVKFNGGEKND